MLFQTNQNPVEVGESIRVFKTPIVNTVQGFKFPDVQKIDVNSCSFWDGYINSTGYQDSTKVWAKRVRRCESMCRAEVCNKYGFCGLMQYGVSTWSENCSGDRTNGFDSLNCAMRMYERGMSSRWECK